MEKEKKLGNQFFVWKIWMNKLKIVKNKLKVLIQKDKRLKL